MRFESLHPASEAAYRSIWDALPGITWTASPAGALTFVGGQWSEIHGLPLEGALGDAWFASVHPDDRERVATAWAHSLATLEPYEIEFRVAVADGSHHWFLVRAQPVFDGSGALACWVGVNVDIQDRHVADEARDLYVSLVENSSDCIAMLDAAGRLTYLNPAGCALLDLESPERAKSTGVMDFVFGSDRPFLESTIAESVRRTGRWSGEFRLRALSSADAVPVACNAFALSGADGRHLGFAAVVRDLRERKRHEDGLRLLARTGAAVVDSLDYQRTLQNIARACVEGFAAYCLIDVMPPGGSWERTAEHRDPALIEVLMNLSQPAGEHPISRAIERGESTVAAIDERWLREVDANEARTVAIRRLGVRSIATVPVITPNGEIIGAITCGRDGEREPYGPTDLSFVQEVGRRAGSAVANARSYSRERSVALEMQAACLPSTLPVVPGVRLDAAYIPGSDDINVGGDWYDAFLLDDGRLMFTIGDVLGHGLKAAALMMRLRIAMKAAAMVRPDPNVVLRIADETLRSYDPNIYATALVAIYDQTTRTVVCASAGHPGPAQRTADGRVVDWTNTGPMIGLRSGSESATFSIAAPPDSALLLYTDGLIEVVRDLDEGYRRLTTSLAREDVASARRPAEALLDAVIGDDRARDDVAVLFAAFA